MNHFSELRRSIVQVADLGFMLRVVGNGNHNGRPEQELQTLKKSQSFEFLFICLNNLKFVDHRKSSVV